jgi:hypothetical protein
MTHSACHMPSAGPAKSRPQSVWVNGQEKILVGDQVVIARQGCENKSGIYKGRHHKTRKLVVWLDDAIVHCSPNEIRKI